MVSDFTPDLPENLPTEEVIVEDEEFRVQQYEINSFTTQPVRDVPPDIKREYEFDKAPIQRIEKVTGVYDGGVVEFNKNTDYKLSDDKERLVWIKSGRQPAPGSLFYVTYRSDSILGRYIESHTDELDKVQNDLNELVGAKFIESANVEELERIGSIFGTLGKRRGRSEEQYRIYLKSIVKSFDSRGTESDIKTALAAATDIPLEDITIDEDFEKTQYSVSIKAATPITGSLIGTVADIADPSGVKQARTKLRIPRDILTIDDNAQLLTSEKLSDDILVTDSKRVNPNRFSITDSPFINSAVVQNGEGIEETILNNDTAKRNPDKQSLPEQLFISDKNNARRNQIDDVTGVSDSPSSEKIPVGWNTGDWGSLYWAAEQD